MGGGGEKNGKKRGIYWKFAKKVMLFYEAYGHDTEISFIDKLNALRNKLRIRNNEISQKNSILLQI